MCDALALSTVHFIAHKVHKDKHTWYVDAAKPQAGYVAAIWGPHLGCCISILPSWVALQQSAKLRAIYMDIKLADQMDPCQPRDVFRLGPSACGRGTGCTLFNT